MQVELEEAMTKKVQPFLVVQEVVGVEESLTRSRRVSDILSKVGNSDAERVK